TRDALFSFTPSGGSLGSIMVAGHAADMGNTKMMQTVTGSTYSVDPTTVLGTLNFRTFSASQLISGTKAFYVSQDGNIVLGGNPGGYDLLFAVHPFTGANANASYAGSYYYAQLSDDASGAPAKLDAISNYGAIIATGTGVGITHQR